MTNIVEDLLRPYTPGGHRRVALEAEAADEIQILRAECDRLRTLLDEAQNARFEQGAAIQRIREENAKLKELWFKDADPNETEYGKEYRGEV